MRLKIIQITVIVRTVVQGKSTVGHQKQEGVACSKVFKEIKVDDCVVKVLSSPLIVLLFPVLKL